MPHLSVRLPPLCPSHLCASRLTRLAWLAPEVLERLVMHREPCAITIYELCLIASLPWEEQVEKVFA